MPEKKKIKKPVVGSKRREAGLTDTVTICMTSELVMNIIKYQRRHQIQDFSKALRELVEIGLAEG